MLWVAARAVVTAMGAGPGARGTTRWIVHALLCLQAVGQNACATAVAITSEICCGTSSGNKKTEPGMVTRVKLSDELLARYRHARDHALRIGPKDGSA